MLDLQLLSKVKNNDKIGFLRFIKFDQQDYLLTNEVGEYIFLPESEFAKFLAGQITDKDEIYTELLAKNFIKDANYEADIISKFRAKNSFLKHGTSLHIVVVTLRCNHQCIYCHASAGNSTDKGLDMDLATAKKVVDLIFKSNNKNIAIEFQGGEPLLNWPVVKFIVEFATEKNRLEKKDLLLRLVSNFSLLDEAKINFLLEHKVEFCTSLDGDEETHNYNRIYCQGNSYQETIKYIKLINQLYNKKLKAQQQEYFKVGAVLTVSRKTMENYKAVIDSYLNLGFRMIYLRYLNPYGFALNSKEKIAYTPDEFLQFYYQALDYILEQNYQGRFFVDFMAVTYLAKILFGLDINNLDLRSPCGAAIGQLAYNYNGDIYTCDEGRMLARMGDTMFRLGNVNEANLEKIVNSENCKSVCLASCVNGLPGFEDNVYQPYLGTCPVYNYSVYNNVFPITTCNDKFKIDQGIIEYLFSKLKDKKNKDIFTEWVTKVKPQINEIINQSIN